jgi:hypothetical protein
MKRLSFNPRFVNEAGDDLVPGKIHTIRQNYDYWKRFEGRDAALFTWEGRPYQRQSRQKVFCVKRLVYVQKIRKEKTRFTIGEYDPSDMWHDPGISIRTLAKNDGFDFFEDFLEWFHDYPSGDMAILHFTDFRY